MKNKKEKKTAFEINVKDNTIKAVERIGRKIVRKKDCKYVYAYNADQALRTYLNKP